jgi:hypothetical protein
MDPIPGSIPDYLLDHLPPISNAQNNPPNPLFLQQPKLMGNEGLSLDLDKGFGYGLG